MKPVPLKDAKIMRSNWFEPPWFSMSPSMSNKISGCGESARLHYVEKIRPARKGIGLLRGSVIHFGAESLLRNNIVDPIDLVETYMRAEIKTIVSKIDDDVWNILQYKYKVPLAKETKKDKEAGVRRLAFDRKEFVTQCVEGIKALAKYITDNHLYPMLDDLDRPMVEAELKYPLVSSDGEILIEKEDGSPVSVRNFLDLVHIDDDGQIYIYDWKTGVKRSSVSEGITPAHTGHALLSYAHAVFHAYPSYSKPIIVTIVRPVLKYSGELVETEEWPVEITREDTNDVVLMYASQAKNIRSVNLHREISWRCPQCDYAQLCLLKKKDDYLWIPSKDDAAEDSEE